MKKNSISRRDFFINGGRFAIAGGLSAIAAVMWKKKRDMTDQICNNNGICSNCIVFKKCKLPQALSAKLANDKNVGRL